MAASVKAATRIQIGKESTRGTLVAATRRLVNPASVMRQQAQEKFEDQLHGTLARTVRVPTVTRQGFEIEYKGPLSFEEILLALLSGVKGGVTPTGAGADKTWTFLPGVSADPAPDTYTIEWVESDFTNNYEIESGYCFCTEFGISAKNEGVPEFTCKMIGRKAQDSTMTAAIALPTLNFLANARWAFYVDSSWANLGTTQISAQIISFDYKFGGFLFPQYYLDNRSDLDFSLYHFRPRKAEITVDAVINADSGGVVRSEQAHKDTPALRFAQLRLTGPTLGSGTYSIKVDGAYTHAEDSMSERGQDRDGNLITRIHLESAYDATSGNDVQFTVVNALTAFPS